jgi:hypothetical protein
MTSFDYILKELGHSLKMSLKPDENNACRISFDSQLSMQLEMDQESRMLLIVCEVGEVPPGKFREELFRSALIENGKPLPRYGDLSFSSKNNTLVIYQFIAPDMIDFDEFLEFFTLFGEKAHDWKDGLETGQLPTVAEVSGEGPAAMFGFVR